MEEVEDEVEVEEEEKKEVEENDKHDYLPTEDGARCPASPPHCCELAGVCNTETTTHNQNTEYTFL